MSAAGRVPGAPRVDAVADGALLAAVLGLLARGAALEAAWPPASGRTAAAAPLGPDAAVLLGLLALHRRLGAALHRLTPPLAAAGVAEAPAPTAGDARWLR
jgi:hypothetical protein